MHLFTFFGDYIVYASSFDAALEALRRSLLDPPGLDGGTHTLDEFVRDRLQRWDSVAPAVEFLSRIPDGTQVEIPEHALPSSLESGQSPLLAVYSGTCEEWLTVLARGRKTEDVFDLTP